MARKYILGNTKDERLHHLKSQVETFQQRLLTEVTNLKKAGVIIRDAVKIMEEFSKVGNEDKKALIVCIDQFDDFVKKYKGFRV